jgi:hypothetical protein
MNRGSTSASEVGAPERQALHLVMNPASTPTSGVGAAFVHLLELEQHRIAHSLAILGTSPRPGTALSL